MLAHEAFFLPACSKSLLRSKKALRLCRVTDDNPETAVDKNGDPLTWRDNRKYRTKKAQENVGKASNYLKDFLIREIFKGLKKNDQVGHM